MVASRSERQKQPKKKIEPTMIESFGGNKEMKKEWMLVSLNDFEQFITMLYDSICLIFRNFFRSLNKQCFKFLFLASIQVFQYLLSHFVLKNVDQVFRAIKDRLIDGCKARRYVVIAHIFLNYRRFVNTINKMRYL